MEFKSLISVAALLGLSTVALGQEYFGNGVNVKGLFSVSANCSSDPFPKLTLTGECDDEDNLQFWEVSTEYNYPNNHSGSYPSIPLTFVSDQFTFKRGSLSVSEGSVSAQEGFSLVNKNGYVLFSVNNQGNVSGNRSFELYANALNNSFQKMGFYPMLDNSTGNFSGWHLKTNYSLPSGPDQKVPLTFSSESYTFQGGDLLVTDPDNESGYTTMARITKEGGIYGTFMGLVKGSLSAYLNSHMYFQFDEETQGWKLLVERPSVHESTPIPFTIETSELLVKNGNLVVNGTIECQKSLKVAEVDAKSLRANDVKVDLNHAADYVFDENYDLKSLSDVEAYVKANKHLPGVPSASELKEEGMSVSEMSNLLLEKVEELTLHLIRVEKENQALKAEIEALKK